MEIWSRNTPRVVITRVYYVSAWECRLEDLLDRAFTSGLSMPGQSPNEMLRDQFWGGQHDYPKEPMKYQMSKITDFDEFRVNQHPAKLKRTILNWRKMNWPAEVKMITADKTNRSLDFDELK